MIRHQQIRRDGRSFMNLLHPAEHPMQPPADTLVCDCRPWLGVVNFQAPCVPAC